MVAKKDSQAWMDEKMDLLRDRCKESGLKVTVQRLAVYQALLETKAHPSAEMVRQKVRQTFPMISLDTVNRTLLTLNDIGAAFIVEGSGDAKRFDGNVEDHQHFKCVQCKRIHDIFHEPFTDIEIPKGLNKKFKVLRKTVYFEGICDRCQDTANG